MLEIALTVWGSIATLAALAAAWVRMRSGKDETIAELWQKEAEAQKARGDRLEGELHELRDEFRAHVSDTNERITRLEGANEALGTLPLSDIKQAIDTGFAEVKGLLGGNNPTVIVK